MKYEIEKIDRFTMIHISGNLDTAESTRLLDNEIAGLGREGRHHFVFDLERTAYLDSAGLSVFIHCLCDVQENDGSVFIIAEDNQVRRVLEMVGMNRLITTYGSREDFFNAQKVDVA